MHSLLVSISSAFLLLATGPRAQDSTLQFAEPGFVSLFDGHSLDTAAWDGSPMWKAEAGEIRAAGTLTAIEFLTYKKKKYQDFILKAKFILVNNQGNSGIHFRSQFLKGRPHNVGGYQADIGWDWWCRLIYWNEIDYGVTGVVPILAYPSTDCSNAIHKDNRWNEYTVTAQGAYVKLEMNGVFCDEFTDTDPRRLKDSGYIALQMHNPEYTQLRFRDIRIKSLDEPATGIAPPPTLPFSGTPAARSRARIYRTREATGIEAGPPEGLVSLKGQAMERKAYHK